jgi:hypothetical protein
MIGRLKYDILNENIPLAQKSIYLPHPQGQ